MMKTKKAYVRIAFQGLVLFFALFITKFLLAFMAPSPLRSVLQGILIFALFYLINQQILKVKVPYYSQIQPLKTQINALIPLWIFMLWANLPLFFEAKLEYIFDAFVYSLVAGLLEEYVVRGLFLGYLEEHIVRDMKSLWFSLLLTSFIFGLAHTSNILTQSLDYTLVQIVTSTVGGLFYGAIYLRTRSLVWAMFAHFLQDFSSLSSQGNIEAVQQDISWFLLFFAIIVFGSLSCILIRPKYMVPIIQERNY
ncbi:CPBP family intramembrane glutamic endopeptidase [Streptococcus parasuis]|uniref:CPBP family intramembrane glutamic endopeptidase n=1 Tax=Streptococcus parasuis TaxID=1501662 RepID=UPI002FCC4B0C